MRRILTAMASILHFLKDSAEHNSMTSKQLDERLLAGQTAVMLSRLARSTFQELWDSEFRVFSQWGEDGILTYLCDSLSIQRPKIIEFGAGNFTECNSRFLAECRNALVTAVDAREDLTSTINSLPIKWRTGIWPIQEWISPITAPEIMATARDLMNGIDILSLDIDGNDYWVAKSLDYSGIKIVVVEYNALFGCKNALTVPESANFVRTNEHYSNLYYGASLLAFIDLFRERGFDFIGTNLACNNAFFVRQELLSSLQQVARQKEDLSKYVEWRVRESRSQVGELTYLSGESRLELIANLKVIDLRKNQLCLLGDVERISPLRDADDI